MDDIIKQIKQLLKSQNKVVAVFDFDYTLTTQDSNSSINVFFNYMPKGYKIKKKTLDLISKVCKNRIVYKIIWKSKLRLLKLYGASKTLDKIAYKEEFKLNSTMLEIINLLSKNNAKIVIYSCGLSEIIKRVFDAYNIELCNCNIISNSIYGITDFVITPYKEKLKGYNDSCVILFGDNINDLKVFDTNYLVHVLDDNPTVVKWGCNYSKY